MTSSAATTPIRAEAPTERPPSPVGTKQPVGERIDWNNYSTGYAMELGATGLTRASIALTELPVVLCENARQLDRAQHLVPDLVCRFRGREPRPAAHGPGLYLPSRAWGATNTFYTTTDGGTDWVPSNSDMLSIACTSSSTCVEVGDGGVIKRTTNVGRHLDRRYHRIRPGAYPGDVPVEHASVTPPVTGARFSRLLTAA